MLTRRTALYIPAAPAIVPFPSLMAVKLWREPERPRLYEIVVGPPNKDMPHANAKELDALARQLGVPFADLARAYVEAESRTENHEILFVRWLDHDV